MAPGSYPRFMQPIDTSLVDVHTASGCTIIIPPGAYNVYDDAGPPQTQTSVFTVLGNSPLRLRFNRNTGLWYNALKVRHCRPRRD